MKEKGGPEARKNSSPRDFFTTISASGRGERVVFLPSRRQRAGLARRDDTALSRREKCSGGCGRTGFLRSSRRSPRAQTQLLDEPVSRPRTTSLSSFPS